jgi:predicted flap endonuclease-1-like 5' DNA nuclease
MPEITVIDIALLALTAVIGVIIGWAVRGKRSLQEKAAINSGWQEQVEAQRTEHQRLLKQSKGLMDQISQFQASNLDAKNRAKKLSVAAQKASARRDELQREIKDIRSNLETVVSQRDQLQTEFATHGDSRNAVAQKDEKIFQLSRELENWQNRLPPLIERYKVRNEEAEQLEADLARARIRIEELENDSVDNQTRIEPVRHPEILTDGRDASNDPSDREVNGQSRSAEKPDDDHPRTLRDNLKKIKGVGPAIEKTLNEMGIFRFQQIADMSEYDIDRVAQRLKGFHSRIYRENWIGQARELSDSNSNV